MPLNFVNQALRCVISLTLTMLVAVQDTAFAAASQAPAPAKLNIVIVEGDGAINNIRQRTAREPIVQVEDENHRPIAGATVLFFLPESGPSGVFPDGTRSLTVVTDQQGRAAARGLRPNNTSGKLQIQVEASYQGLTATGTITQTNAVLTAAATGISAKLIAILAIVGGAATAGVILATRGGNKPPTVISPGTPSVGGPR